MKTIRAIVFQEEKNFDSMQIKEIPFPEPKAGEAVVEMSKDGDMYTHCLDAAQSEEVVDQAQKMRVDLLEKIFQ